MKKTDGEIVMNKATHIAFCSMQGCKVTPLPPDEKGRVSFRVEGKVSVALSELQKNPPVHILDYLQRLETVRSLIFAFKGDKR